MIQLPTSSGRENTNKALPTRSLVRERSIRNRNIESHATVGQSRPQADIHIIPTNAGISRLVITKQHNAKHL